jgi:hypothetical protein
MKLICDSQCGEINLVKKLFGILIVILTALFANQLTSILLG